MQLIPSHDPFWWVSALRVWLILQVMAVAAWPWFTRLFRASRDRGAGLALAGGMLIYQSGSALWWRTGLFTPRYVWAILLMACIGISGRLLPAPDSPSAGTRARMRASFLQGWLVFTVLFGFWAWTRSSDPGVTHTEQPMDVMWMNAALASPQPPVRDAWFGGAPATYYSDGHQGLAFLGLKLGLSPGRSVNLTQITWFALTGLLAFAAGKMLMELSSTKKSGAAGVLALLFVCFASTPAGFFLAKNHSGDWWWWWKASRVISDGDSPLITEFPFFSFWLGDNHAHLIAIPFLLLSVIGSVQLLRARRIRFATALIPSLMIFLSWRINPWQVPTVLALPALALLCRKKRLTLPEIHQILLSFLPGLLFLYPLLAKGPGLEILFNKSGHTNAEELLRVFGFLVPGLLLLFLKRFHAFWITTLLLTAGMYLCVELVYLDDPFHNRMNTLFKVYYQIWILWGLLTAVGWIHFRNRKSGIRKLTFPALLLCLLPALAFSARLTQQASRVSDRSLHAWSRMPPDTQRYLIFATRLIQPGDRIAEAPGDSYDPSSSLLGTWTGGNTLIGWRGHQALWRPEAPHPNLATLYEAPSREKLMAVIRTLDVQWIALGAREHSQYRIPPHWESWLQGAASRVVDQPGQRLYRIRP